MIRKTVWLLVILFLFSSLYTCAIAEEQNKPLFSVSGLIVEIDIANQSFIIEAKDKTEKVILTNTRTVFTRNMDKCNFNDFKVGDLITVSTEDLQGQEIMAKAVFDSETAFFLMTGQNTIVEYNGKIIDIKGNIVVVSTDSGKKTFDITDTRLIKNLKETRISDFKSGDEIYTKSMFPGLAKHEPSLLKPAFLKDPLSYVSELLENTQGPLVLRGVVTEVIEKKFTIKVGDEKVLANKATTLLVPTSFKGFPDLKGKSVIIYSITNPVPGRTYVANCIFVEDALATVRESLERVSKGQKLKLKKVATGKIVKINEDKDTITVDVNGKLTLLNIASCYIQDSGDIDRENLTINYLRNGDTVEAEGYDISMIKGLYIKDKAQTSVPRDTAQLNIYFFADLLSYLSSFETGGINVTNFLPPEKQKESVRSASAGGFPFLVGKYKELSGKSKNNLFLCNGNFLFGTPVGAYTGGEAVIDCLNHAGIQAAILGEQDFYLGKEQLVKLIKKAQFPVLGANVMVQGTNNLLPGLKPYVVINYNGFRVGILGIVNPNTQSLVNKSCLEGIFISDPKPVLINYYSNVAAESDVVILLVSQGFYDNFLLANDFENILPGSTKKPVVIIGGEGREYVGTKPFNANNILILDCGTKGRYLQKMSFGFNKDYTQSNYALYTYFISPGIINKPDGNIQKLIDDFNSKIPDKYNEVLGKSVLWLTRSKNEESALGDLVTDALLKKSGADVALYNGRQLRNDIFEGDITYGLLYTAIPYDFQMTIVEMTGKDLKEVVEQSLRSGEFLQFAGLKVIYNKYPASFSEKRIIELTIGSKPVTDSQTVKVALSSFLADGGEGYRTFAKAKVLTKDGGLIRDIVADYIKELKEVRMGSPDRIIGK